MCRVYDFEDARNRVQEKRLATEKEKELVRAIVDCSITGAAEMTTWEVSGDKKCLKKAESAYRLMQTLLGRLEKLAGGKVE